MAGSFFASTATIGSFGSTRNNSGIKDNDRSGGSLTSNKQKLGRDASTSATCCRLGKVFRSWLENPGKCRHNKDVKDQTNLTYGQRKSAFQFPWSFAASWD